MLHLFTLKILILFCAGRIVDAQTSCNLPYTNTLGHCVSFNECQYVKQKLDSIVNPDVYEEIITRKKFCEQFVANTICCEPETQANSEHSSLSPNMDITTDVNAVELNLGSQDYESHRNFKLFNMQKCGKTGANRVAFGEDAELFEHPWAVKIGYVNRNNIIFSCGGSLISDNYVLTAAHCVTLLPSGYILKRVRLGEYDSRTDIDCDANGKCSEPHQDIEISTSIPHPQFTINRVNNKLTGISNDIALLRLASPAKLAQKNIKAVCLPFERNTTRLTVDFTIIGWGATENFSTYPILQKASIPPVDLSECQAAFSEKSPSFLIDKRQFCAGGKNKKDSCKGDSGGPLLSPDNKYRITQFGIVSSGVATCGQLDIPGIYTNVSDYLNWILDSMY